MAWSSGILYKSDLQDTAFFTHTHTFLIRLKLMINLLEGMHPSNERLSIRDLGTSKK